MFPGIGEMFRKYRAAMRLNHGWSVELTCTGCGHSGVPRFTGWTPSRTILFGGKPTIFADVCCTNCDCSLKDEAAGVLVDLFQPVSLQGRNTRMIAAFLGVIVGVPLLVAAGILLGIKAGYWNLDAYMGLTIMPVLIGPAILWFNYRLARLRRECECGRPEYVFMGLLGRTYCLRCASCGRLMRMRD